MSELPEVSFHNIKVTVNGQLYERQVESRTLLSDFLRDHLDFKGTHIGCEHGVCGCCTVQLNGEPVRSCLMLAVQADGADIRTVEGLAGDDGALHPIQQAFLEAHGFQCGFCTPGFLMTVEAFLRENSQPTEEEIRAAIQGNLCRCTGYDGIVKAIKLAAGKMAAAGTGTAAS